MKDKLSYLIKSPHGGEMEVSVKKAAFHTLGCKVNQYETEAIMENFKKYGYDIVPFEKPADVYVINTCSVTGEAERKSSQAVRHAKNENPFSTVVLTGCMAQVSPEEAKKRTGADIIAGNTEKKDLPAMVEGHISKNSDIMHQHEFLNMEVSGHEGKTRAYIKIQEGCSNFCSYCIIPYARGPVRSRYPEDVLKEAKNLAAKGFTEIVLVGIHLTSYGTDFKKNDSENIDLGEIILRLHDIKGIQRIRLGSLEMTPVLFKIADMAGKLPKLCNHFHISLQSGCDETLLRMRRRYTSAEYLKAVNKLRSAFPGCAVTTDIMVGFPGETRDEFEKSLSFACFAKFAKIHVFKYSVRKGTPAADMPDQVDKKEKIRRAKIMAECAKKSEEEFMRSFVGSKMQVLFEQMENGVNTGHTTNYLSVTVNSSENLQGQSRDVEITGVIEGKLIGEIYS